MLQPLEELRNCNAKASKSIELDYSSLPPQLVLFKALKSKHFVLTAVCAMALLSNLLAVAFAGLFNQQLVFVHHQASFRPPFDLKFGGFDGSMGPDELSQFPENLPSGAYRGGQGRDQFLIAHSNYSVNTPLPAWIDNRMFYLPVFTEDASPVPPNATRFAADTRAFGARLECEALEWGKNIEKFNNFQNVTIPDDSGNVVCHSRVAYNPTCSNETSAMEVTVSLVPRANATQHETNVCTSAVIMGWMRFSPEKCPKGNATPFNPKNALFIRCRTKLITGKASIQVDAGGRLQHPAEELVLDAKSVNDSPELFTNGSHDLIRQSNRMIFPDIGSGGQHNTTFLTSDTMNFFMMRELNSTRLIDPKQPLPTFDEVMDPLNKVYSKLFAIWLGRARKHLLVPSAKEGVPPLEGYRIEPEQRLFLTFTMFIISELILCIYVIVAIWVYVRRPGQYLARLPTSIAAVIALFAGSAAVQDMKHTSHLDKKGRARHLKEVDARYGYGNYVGADGRVHIGIEKTPFVRRRAKTTWLEQKLPVFRKGCKGSE